MVLDWRGTNVKLGLEDATDVLLAEAIAGPANCRRDIEGTLDFISAACDVLLPKWVSTLFLMASPFAGIGLAGVNYQTIKQSVLSRPIHF